MSKIFNFRIGTKLSIMSGIGITLVLAMVAVQKIADLRIREAIDNTYRQRTISEKANNAGSRMRDMQIAQRDALISKTLEDVQRAVENLDKAQAAGAAELQGARLLSSIPDNKAAMAQVETLMAKYGSVATTIAGIKSAAFVKRARGEMSNADVDAAQVAADDVRSANQLISIDAHRILSEIMARANAASEEAVANSRETMTNSELMAIIAGVFAVIVLAGSAAFSALSIARPLRNLIEPLQKIAGGDFKVAVPGIGRQDEVGQISTAVSEMASRVSATILEIKNSGREVTNASAEISVATTDLSQRTEEQAASLEETSAAMEELSSTVKKNAENAQQASANALSTQNIAERGGEVVAHAVDAMSRIEDSSRKISDIIGVIDEIARQTNLLALNAAVEAARAGEAGRGFAVVASEVRSLAQRSSQAAKDIKDLITNSNGQVQEGVELVNRAGQSLTEIVASIKNVAAIVSDIASASIEQSTGLEQINKALSQMDEVTQQNSALVEENAATAKVLENQAKAMDDQVAFFQVNEHPHMRMASGDGISHAAPARSKGHAEAAKSSKPKAAAASGARSFRAPNPVGRMQTALATAVKEDWQEF